MSTDLHASATCSQEHRRTCCFRRSGNWRVSDWTGFITSIKGTFFLTTPKFGGGKFLRHSGSRLPLSTVSWYRLWYHPCCVNLKSHGSWKINIFLLSYFLLTWMIMVRWFCLQDLALWGVYGKMRVSSWEFVRARTDCSASWGFHAVHVALWW